MSDRGWARYAFAATVRFDPDLAGLSVEPETVEVRLYRRAEPPGEDGWRFFRDNLWRGELGDPEHFRALTEDALGTPVDSVEFRALETNEAYLDALKAAISEDLDQFRAEAVSEVLHKYLGSSIEVREQS